MIYFLLWNVATVCNCSVRLSVRDSAQAKYVLIAFNWKKGYRGSPEYVELDRMIVHCRVTPSIKFADTYLYTWVERGSVSVKYLAQKQISWTWNLVNAGNLFYTISEKLACISFVILKLRGNSSITYNVQIFNTQELTLMVAFLNVENATACWKI